MSALGRAWVAAQRNASRKVTVMTGNWEVLSSDIDHNNCVPIGEGSFGPVYQTTITKVSGKAVQQSVVIKKLLDNGDAGAKRRFIREMQAMKEVDNEQICKMIGVVTVEPPLLMVFECGTGLNLKTYLVANRNTAPLTVSAQIKMSFQIAQAMNFLAERNVVHQDLVCHRVSSPHNSPATQATRNCIFIDGNTVKLGDFGLSQILFPTDYVQHGQGELQVPLRWLAPETFVTKQYSAKSDVWYVRCVHVGSHVRRAGRMVCWSGSCSRTPTRHTPPSPTARSRHTWWRAIIPSRPKTVRAMCMLIGTSSAPSSRLTRGRVLKECWQAMAEQRPTFARIVRDLGIILASDSG